MKNFLSEFLSTFFLVFAGTGAIVINQQTGGALTHLGISITFGLVVTGMIYAFGNYSGAHMNPAVTIALTIGNRFPKKDLVLYLSAQLTGAFAASGLLKVLFPACETVGITLPAGTEMQSFILEVILAFFLMFTILSTTQEKNNYAPIAIGLIILLAALFAGPISGASMNPFRSLAPAFVSNNLQSLWIYLTAPILGTILAVFSFNYFQK